jgi:hypothetical protein
MGGPWLPFERLRAVPGGIKIPLGREILSAIFVIQERGKVRGCLFFWVLPHALSGE